MKIQINDHRRELCKVLHNMIGTKQRLNSVYTHQLNWLCEGQNRTINDSLVKFHDENPCDWPNINVGVLFATFRAVS